MSLNKRDSEVGGMLSVPRSKTPADVTNITYNTTNEAEKDKDDGTIDDGTGGGGDGKGGGGNGKGDGKGGGGDGGKGNEVTKDWGVVPTTDPATGVYTGGKIDVAPGAIPAGTDPFTALNTLTQATGALGTKSTGPGEKVDTKQAYDLGSLAKGKGAGDTKKEQKQNESAIANLLSLGQPNVINKGDDKGKKDDKSKDKDKKDKDKGKKSNVSSVLTAATGATYVSDPGQDTKDKDKGDKDKDKGKDKDKKK